MTNTFREHPQRGIFEDIREHPQMAILVLSLTIDSLFQTKIMGVDQILQFRPNFTILEYLELGQFRNFCDVCYSWLIVETSQSWAPRSVQWAAVITNLIFGEEKCNYHQFSHHCGLVVVIVIFWYHQHLLETTVPPQLYSLSSLLNWIYACLKKTIMLWW